MEEIFGTFVAALMPVVGTALSALATLALAALTQWVRTKTKNETVDAAMARVTHTAQTVVDEVAQIMVQRAADGKIDGQDARRIKAAAVRRVQQQLPAAVQTAARMGVTSLTRLIEGKIEQAVAKNKAAIPVAMALEGTIEPAADRGRD